MTALYENLPVNNRCCPTVVASFQNQIPGTSAPLWLWLPPWLHALHRVILHPSASEFTPLHYPGRASPRPTSHSDALECIPMHHNEIKGHNDYLLRNGRLECRNQAVFPPLSGRHDAAGDRR